MTKNLAYSNTPEYTRSIINKTIIDYMILKMEPDNSGSIYNLYDKNNGHVRASVTIKKDFINNKYIFFLEMVPMSFLRIVNKIDQTKYKKAYTSYDFYNEFNNIISIYGFKNKYENNNTSISETNIDPINFNVSKDEIKTSVINKNNDFEIMINNSNTFSIKFTSDLMCDMYKIEIIKDSSSVEKSVSFISDSKYLNFEYFEQNMGGLSYYERVNGPSPIFREAIKLNFNIYRASISPFNTAKLFNDSDVYYYQIKYDLTNIISANLLFPELIMASLYVKDIFCGNIAYSKSPELGIDSYYIDNGVLYFSIFTKNGKLKTKINNELKIVINILLPNILDERRSISIDDLYIKYFGNLDGYDKEYYDNNIEYRYPYILKDKLNNETKSMVNKITTLQNLQSNMVMIDNQRCIRFSYLKNHTMFLLFKNGAVLQPIMVKNGIHYINNIEFGNNDHTYIYIKIKDISDKINDSSNYVSIEDDPIYIIVSDSFYRYNSLYNIRKISETEYHMPYNNKLDLKNSKLISMTADNIGDTYKGITYIKDLNGIYAKSVTIENSAIVDYSFILKDNINIDSSDYIKIDDDDYIYYNSNYGYIQCTDDSPNILSYSRSYYNVYDDKNAIYNIQQGNYPGVDDKIIINVDGSNTNYIGSYIGNTSVDFHSNSETDNFYSYKINSQISNNGTRLLAFVNGYLMNDFIVSNKLYYTLFNGDSILSLCDDPKIFDTPKFIEDPNGLYVYDSELDKYFIPESYSDEDVRYKKYISSIYIVSAGNYDISHDIHTITINKSDDDCYYFSIKTNDNNQDDVVNCIFNKTHVWNSIYRNPFSSKYMILFINGKYIPYDNIIEISPTTFAIKNIESFIEKNSENICEISSLYIYQYIGFDYDDKKSLYTNINSFESIKNFEESTGYTVYECVDNMVEKEESLINKILLEYKDSISTPIILSESADDPTYHDKDTEKSLYEIFGKYVLNSVDIDSNIDLAEEIRSFFSQLYDDDMRMKFSYMTDDEKRKYEY